MLPTASAEEVCVCACGLLPTSEAERPIGKVVGHGRKGRHPLKAVASLDGSLFQKSGESSKTVGWRPTAGRAAFRSQKLRNRPGVRPAAKQRLAQLVEHRPPKPAVTGSNPVLQNRKQKAPGGTGERRLTPGLREPGHIRVASPCMFVKRSL